MGTLLMSGLDKARVLFTSIATNQPLGSSDGDGTGDGWAAAGVSGWIGEWVGSKWVDGITKAVAGKPHLGTESSKILKKSCY
jgi:hypothetical protein